MVRLFVQQHAAAFTWQPGLAAIYSELGHLQEAREVFEQLARADFTDILRDHRGMVSIAYLAEVCTFLVDTRRATILYELLRPYAGHHVIAGHGSACYGSASRYLGMLATTMQRWDAAEQHFEDALLMNTRMGVRPWLAHTQHAYATMLLARNQPGDYEKAMRLLDEALTTTQELGMRPLAERIIARLQQPVVLPSAAQDYPNDLSQREVDVLRLIADGKSNRDIADILCISLNTVASHVRHILAKTGAANRTEAATYAMRHGLRHGQNPLPQQHSWAASCG